MSRCSGIVAATILLMQSASFAVAGELICQGPVCVEGEYHTPFHGFYHFHPRLRDGIPMVQNSQDYYDGYHGTGCIWTEAYAHAFWTNECFGSDLRVLLVRPRSGTSGPEYPGSITVGLFLSGAQTKRPCAVLAWEENLLAVDFVCRDRGETVLTRDPVGPDACEDIFVARLPSGLTMTLTKTLNNSGSPSLRISSAFGSLKLAQVARSVRA